MADEKGKTASGWTLVHDFLRGWGIIEKEYPWPREVWAYELDDQFNLRDITVEQIELLWPELQEKREAEAARIAMMPPIKFDTFTFPQIDAPYPDGA